MAPSRKKKKNAEEPLVTQKKKNAEEPLATLALLELENSQYMEDVEIALRYPHPTSQECLCEIITNITSHRTEQIKALIAEVENLSGTLASFKELDEIMPQTACKSSQTDPTKPATPSPADKPASTLPAPVATKRKQLEALNPPAKRPNLKGPTKLASSRVSKPAAAQVVLHGEKSAAHTVVVSDDPQADPRDIYKAVRAAHTLPQGVWASLRTKGKLVLHSSNPNTITEVTTSLASKLTGMKVRQQKEILPRICLFRVDEETSNSTIEETFLATAAVSQLPGNKVVRVAHRSALRNGTSTAFIEVDLKTFGALGNRGRIVVDGVILNFEASIRARVCFRCCGFGHNSTHCSRAPKCFHCGEDGHEGRSCPTRADQHISKCANCCQKGLSDNHEARASICPILKSKARTSKCKNHYVQNLRFNSCKTARRYGGVNVQRRLPKLTFSWNSCKTARRYGGVNDMGKFDSAAALANLSACSLPSMPLWPLTQQRCTFKWLRLRTISAMSEVFGSSGLQMAWRAARQSEAIAVGCLCMSWIALVAYRIASNSAWKEVQRSWSFSCIGVEGGGRKTAPPTPLRDRDPSCFRPSLIKLLIESSAPSAERPGTKPNCMGENQPCWSASHCSLARMHRSKTLANVLIIVIGRYLSSGLDEVEFCLGMRTSRPAFQGVGKCPRRRHLVKICDKSSCSAGPPRSMHLTPSLSGPGDFLHPHRRIARKISAAVKAGSWLKVGAIVMLLRNFNLKQGLYNGTCMVIQCMCSHVLEGPMLDTLYWCQNIFGSFRYQHSLHSEEARVSNRSEFLSTRTCIYAWTALCGFFTCVNFGWHTSRVEAQILTGTNVGYTVLVPKIYFAPSDISLPFILKRHQFSLKLAFAMTINNIWPNRIGPFCVTCSSYVVKSRDQVT
ncbi:hypothetical protein LAZ67_20001483 [Cordylochernes scorpioides]|uniref:CCHC-type domain-containing protein n=1 Tax=Cordylochernes scorpioides TaxID=51811 RepID=A0ABY6LMJ3_9ARAC|nr:hypothetical protein LAZ67_20001483 [Cordylochernes scorpioides]